MFGKDHNWYFKFTNLVETFSELRKSSCTYCCHIIQWTHSHGPVPWKWCLGKWKIRGCSLPSLFNVFRNLSVFFYLSLRMSGRSQGIWKVDLITCGWGWIQFRATFVYPEVTVEAESSNSFITYLVHLAANSNPEAVWWPKYIQVSCQTNSDTVGKRLTSVCLLSCLYQSETRRYFKTCVPETQS